MAIIYMCLNEQCRTCVTSMIHLCFTPWVKQDKVKTKQKTLTYFFPLIRFSYIVSFHPVTIARIHASTFMHL